MIHMANSSASQEQAPKAKIVKASSVKLPRRGRQAAKLSKPLIDLLKQVKGIGPDELVDLSSVFGSVAEPDQMTVRSVIRNHWREIYGVTNTLTVSFDIETGAPLVKPRKPSTVG